MKTDGPCGEFLPALPDGKPYALCPLPTADTTPLDPIVRDCCRHYGFAVPYSRFAVAVEERVTTVVVTSRLFLLPPARWQAILAHELGHAIDFHLFGLKYRLRDQKPVSSASPQLVAELQHINESESDPELRADALGELLVLKSRGQKLCYDPILTVQLLTETSVPCNGDGSGTELMRHFTHPPLQGKISLKRALRASRSD